MLEELIGLYEEDGSASIATIRQSRTAADAKKLKAAAHALRSPSATLGALNLAEHCRLLELAADSEDPVTLRARIDGLLLEFDHVLSALHRCDGPMTPSVRILLIDDDRVLQMVLERILRSQGADVLAALSGEEGLELAKRHQPQLVICDWCMAEMDGLEVCGRFKADPSLAPIFFILLTSRGASRTGSQDWMPVRMTSSSNPWTSSELTARVRAGLRLLREQPTAQGAEPGSGRAETTARGGTLQCR